ncbi:toxin-antitoxin system YwqK family antitoxin [Variovorax sp. OV700]|uniref:toxin-antitoxin system YwqK family antitoxin n=1 Tax=Variovorax sp. OV700 TaxID=1882826 RepID=UPI000880DBE1|nr:hypothetical protein [Variovorax sp. OV700]SDI59249.1 hypothetical protein SAMN05444748_10614 [Variovorax sp. OV700]
MKQILKALLAPCIAIASAMLLAACSPSTLDFRNAEIVNGKLYRSGSDKPFSGHVTNVPERTVLAGHQEYYPYQSAVSNVLNALGITANYFGVQSLCDVDAEEGVLDGRVVCRMGAGRFLAYEMGFDKGVLDGPIKTYYPNKEDKLLAEATYDDGVLDGTMKVYGLATGRQVLQSTWKKGKPEGKEEIVDDESGKLFSRVFYTKGVVQGEIVRYVRGTDRLAYRAKVVDGMKDGLEEKFDPFSGKLEERREWKMGKPHGDLVRAKLDADNKPTDELALVARYDNGVEVPLKAAAAPAAATNVQGCVDTRVVAFRIQQGDDEVITADQLGEWEAECREGKKP